VPHREERHHHPDLGPLRRRRERLGAAITAAAGIEGLQLRPHLRHLRGGLRQLLREAIVDKDPDVSKLALAAKDLKK